MISTVIETLEVVLEKVLDLVLAGVLSEVPEQILGQVTVKVFEIVIETVVDQVCDQVLEDELQEELEDGERALLEDGLDIPLGRDHRTRPMAVRSLSRCFDRSHLCPENFRSSRQCLCSLPLLCPSLYQTFTT